MTRDPLGNVSTDGGGSEILAAAQPATVTAATEAGRPRVAVIVPAFNEEHAVGDVIASIRANLMNATAIVIDDGSGDRTAQVARRAGARVATLPFNSGIGAAVQTGFQIAHDEQFDVAVQVDGDGQHPPAEVRKLLDEMARSGADYVIGSRFADRTDGYRSSFARRRGIAIFSRLVSALIRQPVTDTTSGLRAANRRAIAIFAAHYPHDYPEVEAIVLARRAGLSIREVPVQMRERQGGRSSITPLRSLYYMVKVGLAVLIQFIGRTPSSKEPS